MANCHDLWNMEGGGGVRVGMEVPLGKRKAANSALPICSQITHVRCLLRSSDVLGGGRGRLVGEPSLDSVKWRAFLGSRLINYSMNSDASSEFYCNGPGLT